jgi:prephenate dehydratase
MVMAVLDEPGSLLGALEPFATRGINLHKIESRPRRGAPFEYLMYVDFMAAADDPEVEAALKEVREHTSLLKILGSYRSAGEPV